MSHRKLHRQAGFTVLELMIASSIFSIVLLVIAAGILRFSQDYYKGVNATNTQAASRAIMNNIVQHIQFGSIDPQPLTTNAGSGAIGYCINNTTYSFVPGKKVDASTTGLVEADGVSCSTSTVADVHNPSYLASNSDTLRDLLGREMRIGQLRIDPNGSGSYTVQLRLLYGDADDMFVDSGGNTPTNATAWQEARCKSRAGQQYCATSTLKTTAQRRL
jgi:prepilin-type N-terminal cleavage/methylation domain-containing protein